MLSDDVTIKINCLAGQITNPIQHETKIQKQFDMF